MNRPLLHSYSFQTVVLKGLGKDITKKHIYKKVRKSGEVKEVIYPVITKAPEAAEGEAKGEDQVEEGTGELRITFIVHHPGRIIRRCFYPT